MENSKKMFPIILINFIALFIATLILPDVIPIHIGLNMQIDRYGSKWFIMLLSILPILIYATANITVARKISADKNYNSKSETIIFAVTNILIIFLSWIFVVLGFQSKLSDSTNISFNIIFWMLFSIGIFITISANYIGTISQNRTLGLRTPWTLRNETNWRKSNRLAGYTGMVGGLAMCFFSVIGLLNKSQYFYIIGLCAGIILFAFVPIVYSFILYKKGNE